MKADLTRNTYDPFQHFARVLMQQGRVQLDADWNEQASILLHYLQTLAADLIGPQGGPSANFGFAITPFGAPPVANDFRIGLGRYYVDGILCEADSETVGFVVLPGNVVQIRAGPVDLGRHAVPEESVGGSIRRRACAGRPAGLQSHRRPNHGHRPIEADLDTAGRARVRHPRFAQGASRDHVSDAAGLSPASRARGKRQPGLPRCLGASDFLRGG